MQDTRSSMIRLGISLMMLVGLIFLLPEDRATSENTTMIESTASDNISRTIISPYSETVTGETITSPSIRL